MRPSLVPSPGRHGNAANDCSEGEYPSTTQSLAEKEHRQKHGKYGCNARERARDVRPHQAVRLEVEQGHCTGEKQSDAREQKRGRHVCRSRSHENRCSTPEQQRRRRDAARSAERRRYPPQSKLGQHKPAAQTERGHQRKNDHGDDDLSSRRESEPNARERLARASICVSRTAIWKFLTLPSVGPKGKRHWAAEFAARCA